MNTTNPTSITNWSANGFYEYLLMAHPNEYVYNKVVIEKQKFYSRYKQEIAVKTKPHITIAAFLCKPEIERELSCFIQPICKQYSASTVTLNDFNGFSTSVIYVRVQNHQPFKQLTKGLKLLDNFFHSHNCPPIKLTTHPHVTIARRLPEQVFCKAILDYKQRSFFETFTMHELVLVRRMHQYHTCQQVNTFSLLPCLVPQGPTSYQLKLAL